MSAASVTASEEPGSASTAHAGVLAEPSRWQVLKAFIKMGLTAYGSPTAHIALMDREFVSRRGWVDRRKFLDLLAIAYVVPGPNSTMMAMNIGYQRRRGLGVFLAGLGFIMPGTLLILALSWAYVRWGTVPQVQAALWGLQVVTLAVIAEALSRFFRRTVDGRVPAIFFALALAAALYGIGAVTIIVAGGLAGWLVAYGRGQMGYSLTAIPLFLLTRALNALGTPGDPDGRGTLAIGWYFLRTALVLFDGSLFVTYLKTDLVDRKGWLTNQQLLDAIALGQAFPGPVLKASAAVGYIVGGLPGAVAATVGIFLPTFIFALAVGRWMPTLDRWPAVRAILHGMAPAMVAVLLAVLISLGRDALVDVQRFALFALAIVALRLRAEPALVFAAGAGIGLIHSGVF
jgi:chromate transporter